MCPARRCVAVTSEALMARRWSAGAAVRCLQDDSEDIKAIKFTCWKEERLVRRQ